MSKIRKNRSRIKTEHSKKSKGYRIYSILRPGAKYRVFDI